MSKPDFEAIFRIFVRAMRWGFMAVLLFVFAVNVATFLAGRKLAAELAGTEQTINCIAQTRLCGQPEIACKNGALIYEEAFKLLPSAPAADSPCRLLANYPQSMDDRLLLSKARTQLTQYAELIALVKNIQKNPKSRQMATEEATLPDWPALTWLQRICEVLVADAIVNGKSGDMSGALSSLETALAASEATKDDPTIAHFVARLESLEQASNALAKVLEWGAVSEPDASRLSGQLAKIDLMPGFINTIRGEKSLMIAQFDWLRASPARDRASQRFGDPSRKSDLYYWLFGRLRSYNDELNALHAADEIIKLATQPYREIGDELWEDVDLRQALSSSTTGDLLNYGYYLRRANECHATIAGTRILLALKVYNSRFGSYPKTLKDLDSTLHWNLNLQDPFFGNDFIYKRKGNGFTLYSIGWNLNDDGGLYCQSQKRPYTESDIVWKLDR